MGSSDLATIIKQEHPCSLHWSFERPKSKMKLSLVITLTVAAVSYASPLQSNLDISSSAETTDHHRMRRSSNGCPYQVTIKYKSGEDTDSGPYKVLKEHYGTYTIQNGHFNGRDWYLSSDGSDAIWYSGTNWIVGLESGKGSKGGFFYNPDDDKCPHQPSWNWKYYVSAIRKWIDADHGMSIYKKT